MCMPVCVDGGKLLRDHTCERKKWIKKVPFLLDDHHTYQLPVCVSIVRKEIKQQNNIKNCCLWIFKWEKQKRLTTGKMHFIQMHDSTIRWAAFLSHTHISQLKFHGNHLNKILTEDFREHKGGKNFLIVNFPLLYIIH